MQIELFSPAKINCFFRVLKRRFDGYCEIATLMQALSFGDEMVFEEAAYDSLDCDDLRVPKDSSNLIFRASNLFRQKTSSKLHLRVILKKNIPMLAGLGGGSSNAASTLWAMRELSGLDISSGELAAWSAELGSDIPFFFSSGTAYCKGRGEQVQSLDPLHGHCFLFKPDFGLSTAKVFAALDFSKTSELSPDGVLQSWLSGSPILVNDLEKPAFSFQPTLESFKSRYNAVMTGSGSCFFSLQAPLSDSEHNLARASFINKGPHSWWSC